MARACKDITHAVIGSYLGPVMPVGIMSNVNARLAKCGKQKNYKINTEELEIGKRYSE